MLINNIGVHFRNILKVQNNILKKQLDSKNEQTDNKLRVIIKTKKTNTLNNDNIKEDSTTLSSDKSENKLSQAGPSQLKNLNTQQKENDQKVNATKRSSSKGDSKKKKKKSKGLKSESAVVAIKQEQNQLTGSINQFSSLNINSRQDEAESNAGTITDQVQTEVNDNILVLMKPPPKLVDQMLTFLSKDLLTKTLEVLITNVFILNY